MINELHHKARHAYTQQLLPLSNPIRPQRTTTKVANFVPNYTICYQQK